jgi:xanthine dehydrogenase molybdenum-binding subunit
MKQISTSVVKKDAAGKTTGAARYTADYPAHNRLYAKVIRSQIAHGQVLSIDTEKAESLPGVKKVLTFQDVPGWNYPTCGHPYNLDESHQDVADKNILSDRVRYYGDEIAAVVAESPFIAEKAARMIEVAYEERPVYLRDEESLDPNALPIHDQGNLLGDEHYEVGSADMDRLFENAAHVIKDSFETSEVQHCNMEPHVAFAYKDDLNRYVVVTSTQIPHVCRRILGQVFKLPVSHFRVIKPVVGGGFGNKQDVVIEPLVVALSMALHGAEVYLEYSREEEMIGTRTRHKARFEISSAVDEQGQIMARRLALITNSGAYAAHGHSVAQVMAGNFIETYLSVEDMAVDLKTAYTNLPVAGAMRAYGVPQVNFAAECHMDNIARKLGLDPVELRLLNMKEDAKINPVTKLEYSVAGLRKAMALGRQRIGWEEKRQAYTKQTGAKRRGVGMAAFTFESGTWPYHQEMAGADLRMNQDGTVQLNMGAVEIGQGAMTVFAQMTAEGLGIGYESVHMDSVTDTDYSPFDTGAYATRQTYVGGQAIRAATKKLKKKILKCAASFLDRKKSELDLRDAQIVEKDSGRSLMGLKELAMDTYYSDTDGGVLSISVSQAVHNNGISTGLTFAEVEVDIQTGRVDILNIFNVHDCGTVINPVLAEGQVHGGMSMGIGYALMEEMKFDAKGRPLNNNLLDYKLPTILDHPELGVEFIESYDACGPFGAKGLGEPPAITPAPAIRNAILQATGVEVNKLPMNPQGLFEHFSAAGLTEEV